MWNWPWKGSCLEGGCFNCQGDNKVVSLDYQGCLFSLYFPPFRLKEAHLRPQVSCLFTFVRQTHPINRQGLHFTVRSAVSKPFRMKPLTEVSQSFHGTWVCNDATEAETLSKQFRVAKRRGTPLLFQGIWFHRGCWELEWVICKESTLQKDLLIIMHDGSCERLLLHFFVCGFSQYHEWCHQSVSAYRYWGWTLNIQATVCWRVIDTVSTYIQLNKDLKYRNKINSSWI